MRQGSTVSVIDRFSSACQQYPDRLAVHSETGSFSYSDLESRVAGLQRELIARGLPDNRLVGVLTGDDPLCYAAILAILACGCAYVPISHRNPAARIELLLEEASLEIVLAHRETDNLRHGISRREGCDVMRADKIAPVAEPIQVAAVDSASLAYLLFTSGSTGTPKGVPVHHGNLNAFVSAMLDGGAYDFSSSDRFLQMFDLTFDASVPAFLLPLCIGASTHVIPENGIVSLSVIRMLQQQDITVAFLVPSVLFYIQRYFDDFRLDELRYSLFVGEALPQSIAEKWAHCVPNARLQNLYGPTEATVVCFRYELEDSLPRDDVENGIVSLGLPFDGMSAFILDEGGVELPSGEKGELCLSGPQVTTGYWKTEARTEGAFFRHHCFPGISYRTGDICYVNSRGNINYCGRKDHQIKIDGYRVELGEIEHHAREAAGGSNAAVVDLTADDGSMFLALFIEKSEVPESDIKKHLENKLPPHMHPRRISLVQDLPLNTNGKIDRHALRELARSG